MAQDRTTWDDVLARLVHDVTTTTALGWSGELAVREDEPVPPQLPTTGSPLRSSLVLTVDGDREVAPPEARRRLDVPQVVVRIGGVEHLVPTEPTADAVAALVDQVQDRVVEELWGAWPRCPRHAHPLRHRGVPLTWTCPLDGSAEAALGDLAD